MTIALGLMSGTSADGVSAALVSFKNHSFRLIAYKTFPYPDPVRKKILHSPELKTAEIAGLHFQLGHLFGEAALKIIRRSKISPAKIRVIGSHGQTIYHGPRDRIPSTLQIGEAAVIAEKTGLPVVSDFRPQDIAAGGEGAPLIPFFDDYFYGGGPVRALLNIGGIANVTIVGKNIKNPRAFDTGPGNSLMDLAVERIARGKQHYDKGGRLAGRGKVEPRWIQAMKRRPYFRKKPPKSTGREEFGEKFLEGHVGRFLKRRPLDVIATLTYFTALTIFESIMGTGSQRDRYGIKVSPPEPVPIKEVIVSGGGVNNLILMRHLRQLFSPLPVRSIEEFGIPAQAKEPAAFAFFGLRALEGKINHLPSVTGARHATVLGKITPQSPVVASGGTVSPCVGAGLVPARCSRADTRSAPTFARTAASPANLPPLRLSNLGIWAGSQ